MLLSEMITMDKKDHITKEEALENLITGVIWRLSIISGLSQDEAFKKVIEDERTELTRIRQCYYTLHIAKKKDSTIS